MIDPDLEALVREALAVAPTETGGIAIVLATSGTPPAMAMLSTGDVFYHATTVSVGVHVSSSTVERLSVSFTLLIPHVLDYWRSVHAWLAEEARPVRC
jgi:hypothetical protein